MFSKIILPLYSDEQIEWIKLKPEERFRETSKLWSFYLSIGGTLDPQPDPQSPFYFTKAQGKGTSNRRSGMHHLRRS